MIDSMTIWPGGSTRGWVRDDRTEDDEAGDVTPRQYPPFHGDGQRDDDDWRTCVEPSESPDVEPIDSTAAVVRAMTSQLHNRPPHDELPW